MRAVGDGYAKAVRSMESGRLVVGLQTVMGRYGKVDMFDVHC